MIGFDVKSRMIGVTVDAWMLVSTSSGEAVPWHSTPV